MADATQTVDSPTPQPASSTTDESTLGWAGTAAVAGAILATFLVVQALGLSLVAAGSVDQVLSQSAGESVQVEGQSGMTLPIGIAAIVLVQFGIILGLIRYGLERVLLAVFMYAAWGMTAWYVFLLFGYSTPSIIAGATLGAGVALALWKVPRWYVLNAIAILWGGIAVGIGGMIATPLPVAVLLGLLLCWDAIAVYRTGHMEELAEGMSGIKLPVMVVYPLSWPFSLPDDLSELADQRAVALGTGDLVIPSLLVASAAAFSPADAITVAGLSVNVPAIGAALGIGVGVIVLLSLRGRMHAGLPPLNIGAMAGYALACVAVGAPLFPA